MYRIYYRCNSYVNKNFYKKIIQMSEITISFDSCNTTILGSDAKRVHLTDI